MTDITSPDGGMAVPEGRPLSVDERAELLTLIGRPPAPPAPPAPPVPPDSRAEPRASAVS